MYSDDEMKKAHLEDFERVLAKLESGTTYKDNPTLQYRITRIKELIKRCSD